MSGSSKLFIEGPAGKLQVLWRSAGHPNDFKRAAIICHPHPMFGGTMENKVVARCARYISEAGIEAIRFNFRGVQQSEGSFDKGRGECDDLRAVIDHVHNIAPSAKLAVAGFSFGAWIALQVGVTQAAVNALVAIAPPVRMSGANASPTGRSHKQLFGFDHPESSSKPALVIYAGNDQYTSAATTNAWIQAAKQPIESVLIPHVDHFFGEQVDEVGRKVAEFLKRVL